MKKWILTAIFTPVLGAIGIGLYTWIGDLHAMTNRQEKYEEAYIRSQEFTQEQRTANELMVQDQERQWEVIQEQKEYMKMLMERMISE